MDGVGAVLRAAAGIFVFMFGLTTAVLGVAGQGFPSEGASRNADCTAALEKGKQLLAQHGSSEAQQLDRKSTRLNSSHTVTSYAVFCLKKKKQRTTNSLLTKAIIRPSSRASLR